MPQENSGRILLIFPDPKEDRVSHLNSNFSLTLGMLGGALKQHGYSVDHRLGYLSWRQTWKPTDEDLQRYDFIGISVNSFQLHMANEMAQQIKAKHPEAFVMGGGAHATFAPQDLLSKGFDFVIRGEGELAVVELADYLVERRRSGQKVRTVDLLGILGLSFVNPETGAVQHSPDRPMIEDPDTLPFCDWEQDDYRRILAEQRRAYSDNHLHGMGKGTTVIASPTFESSRGCPFSCIFCSTSLIKGKAWRAKSPARVSAEITHFMEFYARALPEAAEALKTERNSYLLGIYVDDNFAIDRKRALGICEEFRKLPIPMRWNIMTVAQTVQDPEFTRTLVESGLNLCYLGIESGYEEGLKRVKKGITLALLNKSVAVMNEVGIRQVVFSFIVGFPWETRQLGFLTIQKAFEVQYSNTRNFCASVYTVTPFAGTELASDTYLGTYVTGEPLHGIRKEWGFPHPLLADTDCYDFSVIAYLLNTLAILSYKDYAAAVATFPRYVSLLAESQTRGLRQLGERIAAEARQLEYGATPETVIPTCVSLLKALIDAEVGTMEATDAFVEAPRRVGRRPLPLA